MTSPAVVLPPRWLGGPRGHDAQMRDFLSMVQSLKGVLVLVASPGDALDERAAVQSGVNDWNVRTGRRLRVALLPWLWERHGIPQMGGRPQSLINRQALNQASRGHITLIRRVETH
jgi:hypothetical protein